MDMIRLILYSFLLVTGLYASDDVTELDLTHNPRLTNIDFVRGFPNLTILNLNFCYILGDNYQVVSVLTNLRELKLAGINLTRTEYLLPLKELTYLDISGNRGFPSLEHVVQLTKLERLNLTSDIQIKDLTPLTKLANLNHFEFEYIVAEDERPTDELDDSIFQPIRQLRRLRKLNIGHNTYLKNIRFLASLRHLEKLDVTGNRSIRDWEIIGNLDNLRKLKMRHTYQHDISYVTKLTDLQKLVIDRNVRDLEFRHKLKRLGDLRL